MTETDTLPQKARQELMSIVGDLSAANKAAIVLVAEEDLIQLHHGLGTGIRNQFRHNKIPALFKWSKSQTPDAKHLDDFSMPVIAEIWKTLRAMPEYSDLERVRREYSKLAIQEFHENAENGDVNSQMRLATMYSTGDGVEKNHTESAKWFLKAAEQRFGVAQFHIARMFEYGEGIPQDYEQAYFWYSIEANRRDWDKEEREKNRGRVRALLTAEQIATVDKRIVEWHRKFAESGDARGQSALGLLYARGEHIKQDWVEAYFWAMLATQQSSYEKITDPVGKASAHLTPDQKAEAERRVLDWLRVRPIS